MTIYYVASVITNNQSTRKRSRSDGGRCWLASLYRIYRVVQKCKPLPNYKSPKSYYVVLKHANELIFCRQIKVTKKH